jgi:hypothetical protein
MAQLAAGYKTTKGTMKAISQVRLLDIILRTALLIFNYSAWSSILPLQQRPEVCGDKGFGDWAVFVWKVDIHVRHPAATFAFVYRRLQDILWEGLRFAAEIARLWIVGEQNWSDSETLILHDGLEIDPRFWLF